VPKQPRIRLREPLDAHFSTGETEGRGSVWDVSPGGFFLRSPVLLAPGTELTVQMTTISGWRMEVSGEVCWNTKTVTRLPGLSGFGVRTTRHSDKFAGFVDGTLAVHGVPDEHWDLE
jgi:hypothetical protein